MTLARHPDPAVLADHLERVARLIRRAGPPAIDRAYELAARGYPAATMGAPGRSANGGDSTADAALDPGPFAGIDETLALQLRHLWHAGLDVQHTIARVLSHASDDDPIPAGRGHCQACETFCVGDGGNDRLRGGLCGACAVALSRWRTEYPDGQRSDFIRWRRQQLGVDRAVGSTIVGYDQPRPEPWPENGPPDCPACAAPMEPVTHSTLDGTWTERRTLGAWSCPTPRCMGMVYANPETGEPMRLSEDR